MVLKRDFASTQLSPSFSNSLAAKYRYAFRFLVILSLVVSAGFGLVDNPSSVHAESEETNVSRTALLPMVNAGPPVSNATSCTLNDEEAMIMQYMEEDPEQVRAELHCHPILARVARARAVDMANRRYFGHVNPDGHGPNFLVAAAGYALPDWYPDSPSANNLESIGAHFETPADVWDAWTGADGHRLHVLGADPFFAEQTEVGVGYYYDPDSEYGAYWVVITAPPESDPEPD
jgi:hypothetical protein